MYKFKDVIDADQAVSGIIALHIAEGRHFPLFYYGQAWLFPLDSYIASIFIKFFKNKIIAIKLGSLILYFIGFFLFAYLLKDNLALFLFGLSGYPLFYYSLKELHIATVLWGIILSILFFKIYNSDKIWVYILYGFLSGWALNFNFLTASFILSALILILLKREYKKIFAVLVGIFVGHLPVFIRNTTCDFLTYKFLAASLIGYSPSTLFSYSFSLRISNILQFLNIRFSPSILLILSLLNIPIFCFIIYDIYKNRNKDFKFLYFLLTLLFFLIFCSKRVRYLIGAYVPLYCLVSYLRRKLLLIPVFILNFFVYLFEIKKETISPPIKEIVNFLEDKNLHYGYATYDIAYPIIFLTSEEIEVSTFSGPVFVARYRKYIEDVDSAQRVFYIYRRGEEKFLKEYLKKNNISFKVEQIDDYLIFYDFSERIYPQDFLPDNMKKHIEHEKKRIYFWKLSY